MNRLQQQMPHLYAALIEIAYDNGMVNRFHPEEETISGMFDKLRLRYAPSSIRCLDDHLARMTVDDRNAFVVSEYHERQEIQNRYKIPELYNRMLDYAFDG